jgi:hypothetical protein
MKVTLILSAFVTAIMAQSVDTVSATASGVCEPHNDHWLALLRLPNHPIIDTPQALPRRRPRTHYTPGPCIKDRICSISHDIFAIARRRR